MDGFQQKACSSRSHCQNFSPLITSSKTSLFLRQAKCFFFSHHRHQQIEHAHSVHLILTRSLEKLTSCSDSPASRVEHVNCTHAEESSWGLNMAPSDLRSPKNRKKSRSARKESVQRRTPGPRSSERSKSTADEAQVSLSFCFEEISRFFHERKGPCLSFCRGILVKKVFVSLATMKVRTLRLVEPAVSQQFIL